jgi:hypothetical protein
MDEKNEPAIQAKAGELRVLQKTSDSLRDKVKSWIALKR